MRVLFRIITVLFLFISGSCNKEEYRPSVDQYLFLEQNTSISGELVSGPEPPELQIDFPTYDFNKETGILEGIITFTIDDNLKMIYGSGTCLSGTAGGGCGTGLTGINRVPFESYNFELLKMDEAGNVVFKYKGGLYDLKAGEEWTNQTSNLDTMTIGNELSISAITTTETISNFGFQNKSKIQNWQ